MDFLDEDEGVGEEEMETSSKPSLTRVNSKDGISGSDAMAAFQRAAGSGLGVKSGEHISNAIAAMRTAERDRKSTIEEAQIKKSSELDKFQDEVLSMLPKPNLDGSAPLKKKRTKKRTTFFKKSTRRVSAWSMATGRIFGAGKNKPGGASPRNVATSMLTPPIKFDVYKSPFGGSKKALSPSKTTLRSLELSQIKKERIHEFEAEFKKACEAVAEGCKVGNYPAVADAAEKFAVVARTHLAHAALEAAERLASQFSVDSVRGGNTEPFERVLLKFKKEYFRVRNTRMNVEKIDQETGDA